MGRRRGQRGRLWRPGLRPSASNGEQRYPGVRLEEVLLQRLAREPAMLVRVDRVGGSAPREVGAWMAVWAGGDVLGTVGGGQVEFAAIAEARRRLAGAEAPAGAAAPGGTPVAPGVPDAPVLRYALGPSLGQCCGGEMLLRYERLAVGDVPALRQRLWLPLQPVALFGGGHVGRALVRVLGELPMQVLWVDSREEIFPAQVPAHVQCEHSDPVQAAVPLLPAGSQVLVMSFSHAEDLDVVAACLLRQRQRGDLPFIGLIGSKTKWATFRSRLRARGFTEAELAGVTCPIGLPGITGKQPEVIAVAVAAQLLGLSGGPAGG